MPSDYDVEVEEDEELKKYLPTSFGKQARTANVASQINSSKRKVHVVEKEVTSEQEGNDSNTSDNDDDDDDDDDEDEDEDEFPVSHELLIKTHERAVTTVTLDPSGARLISGSMDCTIKFHDFSSMTPTTVRAFRSVEPAATRVAQKKLLNDETPPVNQALFNPLSPAHILVISAAPQAQIFSRDGELVTTFVKGDMYLRDMHNTKGHVSEITCGVWSPTNKDICATAGTDSTIRIWDINKFRAHKDVIVHRAKAAGSAGRTRMTAVAWGAAPSGNSHMIYAAAFDGSLACWGGDGPYIRPAAEVQEAHARDTWTSGVDISRDGRLVVTRGGDDTIKTWDTRKFKQPITMVSHLSTSSSFQTSNIQFAPNSGSIITGSITGHLHILNPATLRPELVTPVTPGSPLITVLWHEKLNQIITGSANAETHVLYNPNTSTGGAKMVMLKAPKRRHIDDDPTITTDISQGFSGDAVIGYNGRVDRNSSTKPQTGFTVSGKSRDPRRPHIPAATPFGNKNPDEEYIKRSIPLSSLRDEDPRAALLKYAKMSDKDRIFTRAWKDTQPNTIYQDVSDDEADVEAENRNDEGEAGPSAKRVKR